MSCRDLIVRLSPSYKVVRLELADLAFISRAYNPSSSLKPLISLPGRPTYADVVCGRAAPATQWVCVCPFYFLLQKKISSKRWEQTGKKMKMVKSKKNKINVLFLFFSILAFLYFFFAWSKIDLVCLILTYINLFSINFVSISFKKRVAKRDKHLVN